MPHRVVVVVDRSDSGGGHPLDLTSYLATKKTLWQVWHETDAEQAEKDLWVLIHELEPRWLAAAASMKEGWAETLTCQRLGCRRRCSGHWGRRT